MARREGASPPSRRRGQGAAGRPVGRLDGKESPPLRVAAWIATEAVATAVTPQERGKEIMGGRCGQGSAATTAQWAAAWQGEARRQKHGLNGQDAPKIRKPKTVK